MTATVLLSGVNVIPALIIETVTMAPFTVIPVTVKVYTFAAPVCVRTPSVAPLTTKSAPDRPGTSALKVKVSDVVVTELLVPFAVSELNVKAVIATFAATVLLSGVKVNPDLITATVIFDPLGTVMLLMVKRYKPVLLRDKAPFVAPLTLKSDAVKPSMSALNVKARVVVVTALLDPLALRELNVIDVVTTFAATDLLDGVKVTPDLATATVIFDPFGTVILLIPKVYAPVPVLFSNPLVAPVTVISDADKPGTSELKVMNSVVVLTELLDPFPESEEKVIEVVATFAATVLLAGLKVNPVLATATVILDPFDTVILPMPKV